MTADTKPPQFLCIGAHKSGTTWLYENLKRHPDVWLPPVKEVHFFDGMPGLPKIAQRLNRALKDAIDVDRIADAEMLDYLRKYVLDVPKDMSWYRSLFAPARGRTAGDITPAYATLAESIVGKVHDVLPNCRIIFIMRHPISRAWSHLRDNSGKYGLNAGSYRFEDFKRHIDSPSSTARTAYVRTIRTWEKFFPASQILYLFYDDLRDSPRLILQSICNFLGLPFDESYFAATVGSVIHESIVLQMPAQVRAYLAGKYRAEVAALHARFGGPTSQWLAECDAILAGRSVEDGSVVVPHEPIRG